MQKILVVDDSESDFREIARTFHSWFMRNNNGIQDYVIEQLFSGDLNKKKIITILKEKIEKKEVVAVLIDYEINLTKILIRGSEVFGALNSELPYFPSVLLTSFSEDCEESNEVDSDKIYKKREFTVIDSKDSNEKIENLIRNIERYKINKDKLEERLGNLSNSADTIDVFQERIAVEDELSKYIPLGLTQIDRLFNPQNLKEIVDEIERVEGFLKKGE